MKKKKYMSMTDFIAEQNRLERTGGLSADDPKGAFEPMDYPLSPRERDFFKRQLEEAIKGLE